ncbi:hypothetical protein B834_2507 [Enterococcus mundtii 1A]|nr:hypothetical protein [Enterococcus mundtii 1A]
MTEVSSSEKKAEKPKIVFQILGFSAFYQGVTSGTSFI